jgi:ATP-binding cassette subfamily B protein
LYLVVLIFFTLASTAAAIAYPMVFKYLIDILQNNLETQDIDATQRSLIKVAGILIVIGLIRSFAQLYPYFRAIMNLKFENEIREEFFERILYKTSGFFQKFKTGDLITRLTEDLTTWLTITWFMCSGIFRALESLSKFVFCLAAMLYMNVELTLYTVLPLPLMILVFLKLQGKIRRVWDNNKKQISKTNSILETVFSGIKVVKAYNAEENQTGTLESQLEHRVEVEYENTILATIIEITYVLLGNIGQIIVIAIGGYYVITNRITLGEFYAFYVYLGILLIPMLNVPQLFVNGRFAFVNIDRLEEIKHYATNEELERPDKTDKKVNIDRIREIVFENVTYGYARSSFEIKDLTLKLEANTKLAVIGKVGSGKTTLIRLMLGLISPESGRVLINGIDLKKINIFSYWKHIGYVPQDTSLLSNTISENISMNRDHDIKIVDMLSAVNMDKEIGLMSERENTKLSHKGHSISGGQRQRVAIARSLITNPDCVIMDDCTSALDAENEITLWKAVNEKLSKKITILITHRLATAKQADSIIAFEDGKISQIIRTPGTITSDQFSDFCTTV